MQQTLIFKFELILWNFKFPFKHLINLSISKAHKSWPLTLSVPFIVSFFQFIILLTILSVFYFDLQSLILHI